jgi:adenylate kinase
LIRYFLITSVIVLTLFSVYHHNNLSEVCPQKEVCHFKRVYFNKFKNFHTDLEKVEMKILFLKDLYKGQLEVNQFSSHLNKKLYSITMFPKSLNYKNVLIIAGVHGNEDVGVPTAIEWIEENINNPIIRNNYKVTIVPYTNIFGLLEMKRMMKTNKDLNRSFAPGKEEELTHKIIKMVKELKVDLFLDLHEAHRKPGFFVIKSIEDDMGLTSKVLKNIDDKYLFLSPDGKYPYDIPSLKDPKKTAYTMYSKGETVSYNPGTLKGYISKSKGIKCSYTLEAPGAIATFQRKEIYKKLITLYLDYFKDLQTVSSK